MRELTFEQWQDLYDQETFQLAQARGLVNQMDWHIDGAERFDEEMYEEYLIQYMIHNQEH